MLKKDIGISKSIIFLLFSIFFIVGIITFKDYGISVDEEFQRSSGFYWLNYVLSFTFFNELNNAVAIKLAQITGFTLSPIEGNQFYGVIFDLPVVSITTSAPAEPIILEIFFFKCLSVDKNP